MSCYRVIFFKNLLSSDGHPFKCIQRAIDIRHARNADRAVEAAELRYERLHHVHDWTLYADFRWQEGRLLPAGCEAPVRWN